MPLLLSGLFEGVRKVAGSSSFRGTGPLGRRTSAAAAGSGCDKARHACRSLVYVSDDQRQSQRGADPRIRIRTGIRTKYSRRNSSTNSRDSRQQLIGGIGVPEIAGRNPQC